MAGKSEPTARFWHHVVQHGGQIYIRGGRTPHFKEERTQLANTIEKFETTKELWQQIETKGTPHPGLNQAACVCVSDVVYFYGSGRKVLSQLDMKSFVWLQLWKSAEVDNGDAPMIKYACGMVCFIGEYLALFGGYACRSGPLQPGSEFTQSPYGEEGEGWTNELHLFNINKKLWLSPSIKGTRPPPCCDFSLNSVHDLRAVLFGAYQHNGFQDELYIIDFNTSEMDITFTKIEKRRPWPEGRECHTSCVLGLDTKHPQLLISGGKNMYDHPLKFDVWMLDISSLASEKVVWKKVRLPGGERKSRWGHTMTSVVTCAGLEAVVMFGGSPEDFGKKWNSPEFPRLAGTTIFYFGNLGSDWVLVEERIRTDESAFFFSRTSSPSQFTPFELDSQFSMRLIFLMEKAMGIPLLSELANKNQDFQKVIQVRQPDAPSAINRWLSSSSGASKMKPTWRNLSMVLHEIGLGDLALTMEDYLVKQTIDVTRRLEEDMLAHCDKVLDKEDTLRRRIHMFASHSEATIRMVKRKYDESHMDIDLLKREIQTNPISVRTGTEIISSVSVVKAESKEGISAVLPRPTPLTGQSELEQGGKVDYWKQKFDTLSDESDSTIKMLKKENQKLRGDMDKYKGQLLPTPMETEVLTTPIKAESQEDITTAEPQPCTSTSLSANIAPTQHQKQQRMQQLHEQTWRVRYEQLKDQNSTTIQLLEEQSERLRKEVENLRRGEIPSPVRPTGVNGDLNGTASTTMEAVSATPSHSDEGISTVLPRPTPLTDVPAAKRRKHHVPESRSLNSGMPTIIDIMDSDAVPAAKKRKHHVPESRSLDSEMPTIIEIMDSDAFSPISNSASTEVAAQPPPSDISKPSMQNLTVLKWRSNEGKIEKFRLKSQIFHKWREIGTFVLSWPELEVLKDKDPKYCIDVVLQHWVSSPISQYPATWEGLYELLDDSELSVVADELKHAVENASCCVYKLE